MITFETFASVDLRSGTIIKIEDFPRARNASYKIWVDFGEDIGVKQTSAQVTINYTKEVLIGKKILGCVNLEAKNIAGFQSQFLLLGFSDQNDAISLVNVDENVPNGRKLL